jgi:hypothetical protein
MLTEPNSSRPANRLRVVAAAGLVALAVTALTTVEAASGADASALSAAAPVSVVGVHALPGHVGRPEQINAQVTDAAGNRVAGIAVKFAIRGNNSASGTETTNKNGRVAFVYRADKVGEDKVTATAGGVSGHTTAIINRLDSHPTEYVKSPATGVIDIGVRSLAAFAGREVGIYTRAADHRKRVANLTLHSDGTGTYRFTSQRPGRAFTFQVRVLPVANDDYRQFYSAPESVTVR